MSGTDVGLSELPDGWVWTALEEVIQIIDYRGRTPPYSSEGIPHLRSSNIKNGKIIWNDLKYVTEETYDKYMTRGLPRQGDLLFTTEAPLGEVAFAPNKKFSLAQRIMILRPFEDIIKPEFLLYQIQAGSFQERLRISETGSVVKGISSRNFKPFPIIIPPLPEQRRIVVKIEELLTKLDAGINALYKVQSQLKRYRQSVLKAAFDGKLTEAWRTQHQDEIEPASILLERILKKRREKWKAEQLEQMKAKGKIPKDDKWKAKYKELVAPDMNELPKLPKGWTWATAEQLSTKIQYGSSKKTGDDSNGVPVLRMGNIVDGKIVLNNLKYLPKEHDEFPELLLNKGDLLFNRTNSRELVGKTAVYTGIPNPCSFASYLIRVRFHPRIDSMIVAYYINSVYGKDWILSVVSQQAGQANVNGTKLKLLAVPIPPEKEQQVLVEEVERHLSVADEVEKIVTAELKRAEQLRQSILKQAFSGRLVPQDPNDEPASVLLERIKAEKSQHTQGQLKLKLA